MDSKEIGKVVKSAREAKKLSQAQLGRLIGVKQQTLDAIERGETARSKFLPEIAKELDIRPGDVGLPAETPRADMVIERPFMEGRPDFKVYASAEGGSGEIIRSSEPVDFIPRPTHLQHVKDAYGLLITGSSMEPEYKSGEMAIVEPSLAMVPGEVYIFYAERDGEARATIKHLRRATADRWLVTQHNPPEGMANDFTLSRKEWAIAHRVTGKRTRR